MMNVISGTVGVRVPDPQGRPMNYTSKSIDGGFRYTSAGHMEAFFGEGVAEVSRVAAEAIEGMVQARRRMEDGMRDLDSAAAHMAMRLVKGGPEG